MKKEAIKLTRKNPLILDYLEGKETIAGFVDYPAFKLKERLKDLKEQNFDRQALTKVLYSMNEKWQAPKETMTNIERLEEANSVVVIGGQQAGLLTGPLYTINKVISLVQYSRQQEEELGIPVIPVFWIAGEDHDFAEINHVYHLKDQQLHKETIGQFVPERSPVAEIDLDKDRVEPWLEKLFLSLPETVHTREIYDQIGACLKPARTYVDFFARLIFALFEKEGLVLINSQDEALRKIESPYFIKMIEQQEGISQAIFETDFRLKRQGYATTVEINLEDAHLFYHLNGERILLSRDENQNWLGRQGEICFTTEDMLSIAAETPELLSNNVMTRPLMQECLFPTLAFIGGDAEIAYWMLLKDALRKIGKKLPPLIPRLSMTYVNRKTERILEEYQLSVDHIINEGTYEDQMNYLTAARGPDLDLIFDQFNKTLQSIHKPIRQTAYDLGEDLGQYADRNLYYLQSAAKDLRQRMERSLGEEHQQTIHALNYLQQTLHPENGLQERVWSLLPFANEYGLEWIHELYAQNWSFEEDHYVVYL